MRYDLLVTCISDYKSRACARTGEDIRVQGAQLLAGQYSLGGEAYYNPDFLFVGYVSELPADPGKAPHDAVCIEDIPVPAAYEGSSLVNLVLVAPEIDLMELYNRVVFNLADDTRILNHSLFFAELDRSAVTLSGLMNLAYRRLHNPLLLVGANGRVIAYSQNTRFLPAVLTETIRSGRMGEEQMRSAVAENLYEFYEKEGHVPYPRQLPPGTKWCMLPVEVHGFTIARLLALNAESMYFGSDFFFLGRLREVLAELMAGEADLYSDEGLMHSSLFLDLITGDQRDEEVLADRLRFLGWKRSDSMALLVTDRRADSLELATRVLGLAPGSRYLVYGEELVLLLHLPEEERKETLAALEQLLAKEKLKGALSGRFSRYREMRSRYRQAKHIRELAVQLGRTETLSTCERYENYLLAEAVCGVLDPADYVPDGFLRLCDYDEQHSAGLVDTLELYLIYGGLPQEALGELCISKSTAYYRLTKLKELCRLDLENGAVRTQLGIAVAAYRLYGRAGIGG